MSSTLLVMAKIHMNVEFLRKYRFVKEATLDAKEKVTCVVYCREASSPLKHLPLKWSRYLTFLWVESRSYVGGPTITKNVLTQSEDLHCVAST